MNDKAKMGRAVSAALESVTPKKRPIPGRAGYPEHVRALALVAFREMGTVAEACKAANVSRKVWYDWVATDPAFQVAVLEATDHVTDDLEREAIKRAKEGSDTLIIFLLKSRRRDIYGERVQLDVVNHPKVQGFIQAFRRALEVLPMAMRSQVETRVQELLEDSAL